MTSLALIRRSKNHPQEFCYISSFRSSLLDLRFFSVILKVELILYKNLGKEFCVCFFSTKKIVDQLKYRSTG